MAMASLPFSNNLSTSCSATLPPNANRYVRTDFSADGAARAFPGIFPNGKEISLTVDFLTHSQEFFRAGNGTQPATFTTFSIDLNLRHHINCALGLSF